MDKGKAAFKAAMEAAAKKAIDSGKQVEVTLYGIMVIPDVLYAAKAPEFGELPETVRVQRPDGRYALLYRVR